MHEPVIPIQGSLDIRQTVSVLQLVFSIFRLFYRSHSILLMNQEEIIILHRNTILVELKGCIFGVRVTLMRFFGCGCRSGMRSVDYRNCFFRK